jgi:hypothetical protein
MSVSTATTLRDIDWTGYTRIGAGSYSSVFTKPKGRYAIKVGHIAEREVEGLRDGAKVHLAPPVYAFLKGVSFVELPAHIRNACRRCPEFVDILVVGKAKPLRLEALTWQQECRCMEALREAADQAGLNWSDDHGGNVGYYRGKLAILDGINY